MKTDWIAERNLLFADKGSPIRKELIIRIGRPYWVNNYMAACPVKFDGLLAEFADIAGADLLHALYLATDVESFLRQLTDKYDFFFPDGEPYFE